MHQLIRIAAALMVLAVFVFLLDNYAVFWLEWPGLTRMLAHLGILEGNGKPIPDESLIYGWVELTVVAACGLAVVLLVLRSPSRSLDRDADLYTAIAAYLVRGAFWSVFFIGLADMFISFLRVEGLLPALVGDHLATQLGRSIFRGSYIHYPLMAAGFIIALFTRTLGFIWLALLIVAAEFLIVLTRFVFSYEQVFMGDLVRFWYAGLFLFASSYTLVHDGHVRVDVFYANFSPRGKALTNAYGSLLLGLPLCWNILIQGMAGKGSMINSPMLSFEIAQSGFGMYTKYLMAGYLVVFAVTMAIQFTAFFLSNFQVLSQPTKEGEN